MRAFVVTGPKTGEIQDVAPPVASPSQVVVDVHRVGVCGTDVEFFTGEMAYLHQGFAQYPMRLGHEWCGTVGAVGDAVDPAWLGRRVTGDTMLGCGHCTRCLSGHHNVCADRYEIGIRGGFPGALAAQLAVPVTALLELPETVDDGAGAMVEPGGNALRSVHAADLISANLTPVNLGPADLEPANLEPTGRVLVLVLGTGTIGLLVAEFARAAGAEVHLMGEPGRGLAFAKALGFAGIWTEPEIPSLPWHAIIDASNAASLPALALDLVEPGGRVVYIGLAGISSLIDTRALVLKDVTAVGILAASQGLAGVIAQYAAGTVDPRPLIAATVGLERAGDVLAGWRPDDAGPGPKIHIDPRQ